jgi:hypothetical protein
MEMTGLGMSIESSSNLIGTRKFIRYAPPTLVLNVLGIFRVIYSLNVFNLFHSCPAVRVKKIKHHVELKCAVSCQLFNLKVADYQRLQTAELALQRRP